VGGGEVATETGTRVEVGAIVSAPAVLILATVGDDHVVLGARELALYTALFGVLALQGYKAALADIALPHPASVGLHESMGFVLAGVYRGIGYKLGGWHDVGWWQRDLAPREANPAEPRALPEILGDEAFSQALAAGERLLDEARIGGAMRAAGG
jgi:hypothetical protein